MIKLIFLDIDGCVLTEQGRLLKPDFYSINLEYADPMVISNLNYLTGTLVPDAKIIITSGRGFMFSKDELSDWLKTSGANFTDKILEAHGCDFEVPCSIEKSSVVARILDRYHDEQGEFRFVIFDDIPYIDEQLHSKQVLVDYMVGITLRQCYKVEIILNRY